MQSCKVWFASLGLCDAQSFLHNGLENDWEAEAAYFMRKAVLEQPATLSRLARQACESFYVEIGQEQLALPSRQGSILSIVGWSGRGAECTTSYVTSA